MELSSYSTGKYFEAMLYSFFFAVVLIFFSTAFAKRTKLLDIPNIEAHKKHKTIVPISGGIAFFGAFVISVLIFKKYASKQVLGILLGSAVIFIFGLWDDYKRLKPWQKIIGQLIGTMVAIITNTQAHVLEALTVNFYISPYIAYIGDLLITIFWFVFITNAYNLIDSMDGLMLGIASWSIGFFLIAAIDAGQKDLAIFCACILGSTLGLIFFNSYPAFIFMGDSGAQTIGFLLAAIAIDYTPAQRLQGSTWFMPMMLLGVPIFDTTLVIISRFRRGLHFYSSGTDHTYHRLVELGLSHIQSVIFLHMVTFVLEVLAFFAISQTPLIANIIFGFIVVLGILLIVFFESKNLWPKITRFIQKSTPPEKNLDPKNPS